MKTTATTFIEYQNGVYRRIITRIYILLIIFVIGFIVSVVDSIYIRHNQLEEVVNEVTNSIKCECHDED